MLSLLMGCSILKTKKPAKPQTRNNFVSQIFSFRKDYPDAITNRDDIDIRAYSLHSKDLRRALNSLNFVCKIGPKFYHFCPHKPTLCRKTAQCELWHKRRFRKNICVKYKREPVKSHDYLVKSGAYCYSENIYPNGF